MRRIRAPYPWAVIAPTKKFTKSPSIKLLSPLFVKHHFCGLLFFFRGLPIQVKTAIVPTSCTVPPHGFGPVLAGACGWTRPSQKRLPASSVGACQLPAQGLGAATTGASSQSQGLDSSETSFSALVGARSPSSPQACPGSSNFPFAAVSLSQESHSSHCSQG